MCHMSSIVQCVLCIKDLEMNTAGNVNQISKQFLLVLYQENKCYLNPAAAVNIQVLLHFPSFISLTKVKSVKFMFVHCKLHDN